MSNIVRKCFSSETGDQIGPVRLANYLKPAVMLPHHPAQQLQHRHRHRYQPLVHHYRHHPVQEKCLDFSFNHSFSKICTKFAECIFKQHKITANMHRQCMRLSYLLASQKNRRFPCSKISSFQFCLLLGLQIKSFQRIQMNGSTHLHDIGGCYWCHLEGWFVCYEIVITNHVAWVHLSQPVP